MILCDFVNMVSSVIKPNFYKHINCRNSVYPLSLIKRENVPDELIYWNVAYKEYNPPIYTAPNVIDKIWADPDINSNNKSFSPSWNTLDGDINRKSYNGCYKIVDGFPLNLFGRTGLRGRGLLGRWGPNHAADPIVTRWKRDSFGNILINDTTKKPIIQMVAIKRNDNKKWAIPGGMVDPGENVTTTLKREFKEEALNSSEVPEIIDKFFSNGTEIYKGYVDDYRNTDNAWIETIACNFHDDKGNIVGKFQLAAGDDATNVKWMDIDSSIKLHANHALIIKTVIDKLNGHW